MNTIGDGWKHTSDSPITERDAVKKEDPFTHVSFEDGMDNTEPPADQNPSRRKRIAGALLFLVVLIAAGVGIWMMFDSARTRINVPVRDNASSADPLARGGDDATMQAIAEVRSATATPKSGASASQGTGKTETTEGTRTIVVPTTPVTIPIEGVGGAVSSPSTEAATGQQGGASRTQPGSPAKTIGIVSERNPERSIRCAPVPAAISSHQPMPEMSPALSPNTGSPVLKRASAESVVLPPFGALLPIRTMGALYTLRPGLARFELSRDVRGQGWHLRKGTTIIGQQQGGEYDRAYISLVGFIDPESKRLVKAQGEVLGADGAPGLQGKRRHISSRWARVFGRMATSAVSLGQAALTRGNSTTVVLSGSVAPELTPSVASSREFIEVAAGTPAFVMITDLPKESQGVETDSLAEGNGEALKDQELAELLSSESPEKIRAAMPRMTPELRRIAEAVLKEQSR